MVTGELRYLARRLTKEQSMAEVAVYQAASIYREMVNMYAQRLDAFRAHSPSQSSRTALFVVTD